MCSVIKLTAFYSRKNTGSPGFKGMAKEAVCIKLPGLQKKKNCPTHSSHLGFKNFVSYN